MSPQASQAELEILVIDSHDLVRQAIGHLLSQADVGRVRTTATLEAHEPSKDPDVIVVEPLSLGSAAEAPRIVREVRMRYSRSQILVLTHGESPADAQRWLSAGAHGYVPKRASGWDLIDAIGRIARGEEYLHPSLGASLAKSQLDQAASEEQRLNHTERQVLHMLALGHTNAEASRILNYGVRTVEGYRSRIMKKLGLATRADIVRAAIELGLLNSIDTSKVPSSTE